MVVDGSIGRPMVPKMRIDPSTDIYDRYRSRASDITCLHHDMLTVFAPHPLPTPTMRAFLIAGCALCQSLPVPLTPLLIPPFPHRACTALQMEAHALPDRRNIVTCIRVMARFCREVPTIARLRSCAARKVKRAVRAAVKKAKQAFHDGIDLWMRRLRFDHVSGPGGGGGLGGGLGGGDAPLLA